MTWEGFIVLALAAFRVTRLAGVDDLTIKPRRWLTGVSDEDHEALAEHVDAVMGQGGDPWDDDYAPIGPARFYVSRLIRCPWCLGFWVSAAISVAYWSWPHGTLAVSIPFALSAVVGLVAKLDE